MCHCTPEIKTPWCGKPGCEMPPQPQPSGGGDVDATARLREIEARWREATKPLPTLADLDTYDAAQHAQWQAMRIARNHARDDIEFLLSLLSPLRVPQETTPDDLRSLLQTTEAERDEAGSSTDRFRLMVRHIARSEWGPIACVPEHVRHALRGRLEWPFPEAWPSLTWAEFDAQWEAAESRLTALTHERCELHTPDKWEGDGTCIVCEGQQLADRLTALTQAQQRLIEQWRAKYKANGPFAFSLCADELARLGPATDLADKESK